MPIDREKLHRLGQFLLDRLKEGSTWCHIVNGIGTLIGRKLAPEWAALITDAGMTIAFIIGYLTVQAQPAGPRP